MKRRSALLALLVAFCLALVGIQWRVTSNRALPTGLVIVTLDTTRADRLPAYGLMDVSMPHLDRLAREGVVFDQATSVAPLTLPAHASMFTGLFPPAHRVRDNSDRPLAVEHTTLAEILNERGFHTGAFVGSIVLDAGRGLEQGFNRYSGVEASSQSGLHRQRRADEVITDAISWLDDVADSRFFLWAHLYDPHLPYDPPEPYRSAHSDPYVGEIAFADSQIGRLLQALDARQLMDRTVVMVVGDHGESLGDHGESDHGRLIYESVLRVPFIVRSPSITPRRVADVVRLVDVMPTALDLLGLASRSPASIDGVSLFGAMTGQRSLDLEAYSESLYPERVGGSLLRAIRGRQFKLIDAAAPELYDLDRDPFEEHNVYGSERAAADALGIQLAALEQRRGWDPVTRYNPAPVPAELEERLRTLGYLSKGR